MQPVYIRLEPAFSEHAIFGYSCSLVTAKDVPKNVFASEQCLSHLNTHSISVKV